MADAAASRGAAGAASRVTYVEEDDESAWPATSDAAELEDEDEEEEDDDDMRMRALPADGDPDFDSGPPADGLEYLRRVRWEAARCPAVVRSAIDPRQYDSKRTNYAPRPADFAAAPPGTEATQAWVEAFQPEFSDLRSALRRTVDEAAGGSAQPQAPHLLPPPQPLPPLQDGAAWQRFCLGGATRHAADEDERADAAAAAAAAEADDAHGHGHPPSLRVLTSLDEVGTVTLLQRCINWLEDAPTLSRQHALWLFALLARVDRPLDPDTGAALRQLCRRLCALRAACSGSGVAPGSPDAEAVPRINLLLAAAGEYHGAARGLYAQ